MLVASVPNARLLRRASVDPLILQSQVAVSYVNGPDAAAPFPGRGVVTGICGCQ